MLDDRAVQAVHAKNQEIPAKLDAAQYVRRTAAHMDCYRSPYYLICTSPLQDLKNPELSFVHVLSFAQRRQGSLGDNQVQRYSMNLKEKLCIFSKDLFTFIV